MRRTPALLLGSALLLSLPAPAHAASQPHAAAYVSRTLHVGPGRALTTPSAAAAVARDGDRIEIDAGSYTGDVVTWTQDDLTLVGVGGMARLAAGGQSAQDKATWVISGDRTTVQNIVFSGARASDANGAGIRQEGAGLVVDHCFFHHDQDGILAGANPASDIVVRRSRFSHLLPGIGQTHLLYIGAVRSFTLVGSYVTGASQGHEVKSRALRTTITGNRIADLQSEASYSIDLPNGGDVLVAGNLVEQGPRSPNSTLVSFGAEGLTNPTNRLWLVNNTLVNDKDRGTFVALADGSSDIHLWNNLIVGPGTVVAGASAERRADVRVGRDGFVDAPHLDFRLEPGSPAVNRGVLPPTRSRARYEYRQPLRYVARQVVGRVDLGAFEYVP